MFSEALSWWEEGIMPIPWIFVIVKPDTATRLPSITEQNEGDYII